MRWGESCLFDLGEIIDGVLVECHFTESTKRNFAMWPNFCQVKDIPTEFLGLFRGEDLHVTCPRREIAGIDVVEEILCGVIRILAREFAGSFVIEGLDTLINLEMDLDVVERTVFVDKFQGVATVTVHMCITIGGASIREEDHNLMDRFGVCRQIIPEHIGIFQIGLRITFLSMNEKRKFGGISKEEHRSVVHHLHRRY